MRRFALVLLTSAALTTPTLHAQPATKLPVKRVVLYKNGVGFFEHVGPVRGTQAIAIDFNTAQLNDVLKSLTTLDLGSGRIADVSFNSEAPPAQRTQTLALPLGDRPTLVDLLGALRGSRVEVRGGGRTVVGRLLGVERQTRSKDENTTRDEITVISDAGELRSIEITPTVSVRLAERESAETVRGYLGVLASARSKDRRTMTISAVGTGARDILVSYISEVPVWKTTYRIVVPAAGPAGAVVHGWAIVDNTIGEDWTNVELSLVAGAPQSFVQPLSQPLYVQRPVVAVARGLTPTPQVHQETLVVNAAPKALVASTSGSAGGRTSGIVGGLAEAPPPPPALIRAGGNLRGVVEEKLDELQAAAQGQSLGDLFEYRVKGPITIRKNQSALVPILTSRIDVDRVSLWNDRIGGARPLRSLWLTNTTGLTLDAGAVTVIEDAFAGEGLIDPIKPGERRLLSYAVDLGVQVESARGDDRRRVTRVQVDRGVAIVHSEVRSRKVYTIRNSNTDARTVVVEHPVRAGWTLASGGAAPTETSLSAYRFAVPVASSETARLVVNERHPIEERVALTALDDRQIAVFVQNGGDDARMREMLAPIQAQKAAIASLDGDLALARGETDRLTADQQRVRENMRALKGSAGEQMLLKRYVAQLNEQEDRLATLRRRTTELTQTLDQARADLAAMLERLSLDVELADGDSKA
jgi:hypothetical protein